MVILLLTDLMYGPLSMLLIAKPFKLQQDQLYYLEQFMSGESLGLIRSSEDMRPDIATEKPGRYLTITMEMN